MPSVPAILFVVVVLAVPIAIVIIRRIGVVAVTDTLIINEDPKLSDGSVVGRLVEKKTGRNGRLHIVFIPLDREEKKPLEIIKEPNKIINYPKGTFSKKVSILRILPDDSVSYFSNMLSRIENESAAMNIIKAMKEGLKRQAQHLGEIGEGELSAFHLGQLVSSNEEILKSKIKEPDKRPQGRWDQPAI